MRRSLFLVLAALLCVNADASYAQKKKKHAKKAAQTESNAEPDKVLYDRALNDLRRGRHEIGRLTLQTLINTYPDSEYLAKAKLSIGDSFFKEAGSANLAQAIAAYKDFIVFFPFLPEAAYAQLQVGMAHYKQMEKPDRDRTQARAAEDEFQTFLQKYPADPLAPQADQRLREVQEILAEGNFRIGNFYYIKGSYRSAAARLITVTNRYPLYSRADRALWMLGTIFEKSERKDIAANYYARIVRDYPLSSTAESAQQKLKDLGRPVPQPDPQALARMQREKEVERGHASLFHKATGILHSGPDVRMAARTGKPNLEPESVSSSPVDILRPGGQNSVGGGANSVVATVTPGTTSSGSAENAGATGTTDSSGATSSEGQATSGKSNPAPDEGAGAAASTETKPGATTRGQTDGGTGSTGAPDKGDAAPGANAGNTAPSPDGKNAPADKKKESTNKKKKGLRKIIPW